jgi:hypothetical protein
VLRDRNSNSGPSVLPSHDSASTPRVDAESSLTDHGYVDVDPAGLCIGCSGHRCCSEDRNRDEFEQVYPRILEFDGRSFMDIEDSVLQENFAGVTDRQRQNAKGPAGLILRARGLLGAISLPQYLATTRRVDEYWRTRTIAEAQEQGYSHLMRATFSACGLESALSLFLPAYALPLCPPRPRP